jgi:hypothetical protein
VSATARALWVISRGRCASQEVSRAYRLALFASRSRRPSTRCCGVADSVDASLRHFCAVATHSNANLRNVSRCSHSVACLPASMLSRANQSNTSAMFMATYSSTVPRSPCAGVGLSVPRIGGFLILCWSRLERFIRTSVTGLCTASIGPCIISPLLVSASTFPTCLRACHGCLIAGVRFACGDSARNRSGRSARAGERRRSGWNLNRLEPASAACR